MISDGPLPSPAAELIALSLTLGDPVLEKRAKAALNAGSAEVSAQPLWYANHARLMINAGVVIK